MNKFLHFLARNKQFPIFAGVAVSRLIWAPFLLSFIGFEFSPVCIVHGICTVIEILLLVFYKKLSRLLSFTIFMVEITIFCVLEAGFTNMTCGMDICIYALIPGIFLFTSDLKRPKHYVLCMNTMFVLALSFIIWIKLNELPPTQLFLPERRHYLIASEIYYTCASLLFLLYGCLFTSSTFSRLRRKNSWFLTQLDDIAKHDPLTGLMNRRRTHLIFDQCVNAKKVDHTEYAIAIFDIDNFKKINDTWGHDAGDFILKSFTRKVWDYLPEPVRIGRWGGEEFVIIFPAIDENTIYRLEDIRQAITKDPVDYNGNPITVTATFGICSSREFASPEAILTEADAMLLIGKQNGKNRIVVSPKF